jgi:hypothetical protein
MKNNKVFVLVADGVGFRNFAYSGFYEHRIKENLEFVFWNNTPFNITDSGFPEVRINNVKLHPFTDVYKKARVQIELDLNIKKTKDRVYDSYRFPFFYGSIRGAIKSIIVNWLHFTHSSENGLLKIRKKINNFERKSDLYKESIATLKKQKPAMVFCTNQRHITTVAPLLAAQDLGIPTAAFIYSWDNLPKATLVVETDYYFVWSEYMKNELQFYYPYIKSSQVFVTGSPQFEMHFNKNKILDRETFCAAHGLDSSKKYICYSGNDIVSCPDDPVYLEDVAKAVTGLNQKGADLAIIFRKCPVDFSSRFDEVLAKYPHIIKPIDPLWKPLGSVWNAILPTKEDDELLANIAEHSAMVINVGSSTVFDFISHEKPCGYLRYNQQLQLNPNWDIHKCYKFVHFRSMPDNDAVFWLDSPQIMATDIERMLGDEAQKVTEKTRLWFERINQHPPQDASKRIVSAIAQIMHNHEEK